MTAAPRNLSTHPATVYVLFDLTRVVGVYDRREVAEADARLLDDDFWDRAAHYEALATDEAGVGSGVRIEEHAVLTTARGLGGVADADHL